CFLPSKGWMVLCRAVDTFLLYFGLVVALLFPRTWVCPLRTGCALRFLAAWVDCHSFMFFPFSDRKSTRLNSSHVSISYAVFYLYSVLPCISPLSLHDALPILFFAVERVDGPLSGG